MKCVFVILSYCFFVSIGFASDTASTISFEELKEAILRNEVKLLNVQVDGKFSAEEWNAEENKWQFAGEADVTAYFPNAPDSKMRIDFHKQLIPWVDGPTTVSEDVYSVAYNGRYAQTLYKSTGSPHKPYTRLRGEIKTKRPDISATGTFASGWAFSSYGFGDKMGKSISECLGFDFDSQDIDLTVKKSEFNGKECIQLNLSERNNKKQELLYFDPQHGYALLGEETISSKGNLIRRMVVEELQEPKSGVYYPSKATLYSFSSSGEPRIRKHYEASSIVANNPEFAEDIFTIEWPDGTIVYDKMTDITFIVGKSERELLDLLGSQAADSMAELADIEEPPNNAIDQTIMDPANQTDKDGNSSPEPQGDILADTTSGESLSNQKWILLIAFVAIGLTAVLIFLFLFKAKLRKILSVLLFTPIILLGQQRTIAQGLSPAIQELGDARISNCGLNTFVFVLKYFGHNTDLTKLSKQLEVGDHWENAVNMLTIKQTLQESGLKVEAFKNATIDEILAEVNKERICIIHILVGNASVGHYYVIMATGQKGIFVVNAGKNTSWITIEKFKNDFENIFTGYCMFVSSEHVLRSNVQTKFYSLDAKEIIIDLNDIISGQGTIDVNVPIYNSTDKDIVIEKIMGSCTCFRGATLKSRLEKSSTYQIGAFSKETMLLSFDRESFGTGQSERLVLLNISKPESKKVLIRIKANIIGTGLENKIAWFPEKIDYGLVLDPNQISKNQLITLFLPQDISVSKVSTSSINIKVKSIDTEKAQNILSNEGGKRRICQYEITLLEVPEQRLNEYIEFSITDETLPKITIPIIARIPQIQL